MTDEITLTHDEKRELDAASCSSHRPGTETFICSPCATAQNAVILRIINDRVKAERTRWATKFADNANHATVSLSQWLSDLNDQIVGLCHWHQNREGVQSTHSHLRFHFDNPCPYEAVAAVLRGDPDPREQS